MRLYTMHKREFVMTFIAFFISLGLAIFIGIAGEIFSHEDSIYFSFSLKTGPPITSTAELDGRLLLPKNNLSDMSPGQIATGPFTMRTPSLTTYSQQLWLIVKLSTGNKDGKFSKSELYK